ncbi:hypothetical protein G647_01552 [Cladophialophora carrionii CBS 160.54]|uniref:Uncharacterized protein n=1 Tax=Cladophialophora carrionii CBS 160.54 TaxID=1279043 RepID=V9DQA8_9EURO|nr:uncharacterized protein G647_01552 [Cladophialophora carrionii CBS 160.54]ETI29099.1 hypothetical protein G647_01552 [Cladophialophora carrionii CBS 160.54]
MGFPWPLSSHKEETYHDRSPASDISAHQEPYVTEALLAPEDVRPYTDSKPRRQILLQRCINIILFLVILAESIALYRCKRHLLVRQTPVPNFINVERTWIPDQRFAHKYMFSDNNAFAEVYKGWETLFPCKSTSFPQLGRPSLANPNLQLIFITSTAAMGMIHIDDGQSYINNPPYQSTLTLLGGSDAYMVTSIHQLHCLRIILSTYGVLRLGGTNDVDDAHLAHCFDYLRQGLMCSIDTSIEGNSTEYGEGWGSVHVCKDYSKIVKWIDHQTEGLEQVRTESQG